MMKQMNDFAGNERNSTEETKKKEFVRPRKMTKRQQRKQRKPEMSKRLGMGKKRWGRLGRKEWLILMLPALAAIIAAAVILFLNRDVNSLRLEKGACQYYAGNIYRMQEDDTLTRTSDGKTVLNYGKNDHSFSSLPIYYENKDSITLTQDMAIYIPRTDTIARADYFSSINFIKENVAELSRSGDKKQLRPGFLYDGRDTYVFLEPMTLSFNGYSVELSPLSYVEADYKGEVTVFNYKTKEFIIEEPWGDVTASNAGGDYTLSLLGDSMISHNGQRTLLFTRPELLEPLP